MQKLTIALLLCILAVGCTSPVPRPTEADVPRAQKVDAGVDLAVLSKGRARYVSRCSSCHTLPLPDAVAPGDWPKTLEDMLPRARLKPDEKRAVSVYVQTMFCTGRE